MVFHLILWEAPSRDPPSLRDGCNDALQLHTVYMVRMNDQGDAFQQQLVVASNQFYCF